MNNNAVVCTYTVRTTEPQMKEWEQRGFPQLYLWFPDPYSGALFPCAVEVTDPEQARSAFRPVKIELLPDHTAATIEYLASSQGVYVVDGEHREYGLVLQVTCADTTERRAKVIVDDWGIDRLERVGLPPVELIVF